MSTPLAILINQAETHEQSGRKVEAVDSWKQIVAVDPTAHHWRRYASILWEVNRLEEAEAAARSAVKLDDSALSWAQLGLVLRDSGRLESAHEALEQSLAREELQAILTILGAVSRRIGDLLGAERSLRRSLELNPQDDEAWTQLGLTLEPSRPDEAADALRSSLRIDPSALDVRQVLARVLLATRRFNEAIHVAKDAVAQDPSDAWSHNLLGQALEGAGRLAAAGEEYGRAIELDPADPDYLCYLAGVREKLGDPGSPEALYRQALTLDANNVTANLFYGLFLARTGFPAKALRYLERARHAAPTSQAVKAALDHLRRLT